MGNEILKSVIFNNTDTFLVVFMLPSLIMAGALIISAQIPAITILIMSVIMACSLGTLMTIPPQFSSDDVWVTILTVFVLSMMNNLWAIKSFSNYRRKCKCKLSP